MDHAPQHPDSSRVAASSREAADHVDCAANLPAVDDGVQLLTRVEAMMRRIMALEQTMTARLDKMETKLEALDRRVSINVANGVARAQNSTSIHGDMPLNPLLSMDTGREIEGFPGTVQDAMDMSAGEVERMLREMAVATGGTEQEKWRRMMLAIGVTTLLI